MKSLSYRVLPFLMGCLFGISAQRLLAQSPKSPRYAVINQFQSSLKHDEVLAKISERAVDFKALSGLEQKYYLHNPQTKTYAGVYLWRSKKDLDDYLASDLRKSLKSAYAVKGSPKGQAFELIKILRDERAP